MTKIKEFLRSKLINFRLFINDQLLIVKENGIEIDMQNVLVLMNELDFYSNNLEQFITVISVLNNKTIDDSIKLFLLKYNIDINLIKEHIDYDKLKRYIEMFIDIVKK